MGEYRFFDPKYDEFLEHSGVPGMKWGVRNYQYTDGTWTELGKERRRIGEAFRGGKNVTTEKSKHNRKTSEEEFVDSIRDDVYQVNKSVILDEFNIKHNPFRKNNCGYCAVAYELRRRGIDARANLAHSGVLITKVEDVFEKQFETPKSTKYESGMNLKAVTMLSEFEKKSKSDISIDQFGIVRANYSKDRDVDLTKSNVMNQVRQTSFKKPEIRRIESELRSQGDGARGIFDISWQSNDGKDISGHYANYEIHKNKLYVIDCQDRTIYRSISPYLERSWRMSYIRTDDATINSNKINELFEKNFKTIKHSEVLSMTQMDSRRITTNEVVSSFKEMFSDLEILNLRIVGDWYVFTIVNAPTEMHGPFEVAIDPYIGYNIKTKEWDRLSPPMLGIKKFFDAKPIPFE